MPKPELEYSVPVTAADSSAWVELPGLVGVSEQILALDSDTGAYTRLLKLAPRTDATPMGKQCHDFWEEAIILEGSITDVSLNEVFSAGAYTCRPPGMEHGPWRTEIGAMVFEVRGAPGQPKG